MAGRERDPIDVDMQSSVADAHGDATSSALSNDVSLNEKIGPGDPSSRGNKEVVVQSTTINAPETNLHNLESGPQCDRRQTHRQIPDSKDKGKTPMRTSSDIPDGSVPKNGEVSERDTPQSRARTSNPPSITENLSMSKLSNASNASDTDGVNGEVASGPALEDCDQHRSQLASPESVSGISDVKSQTKSPGTPSQEPHINDSQPPKQEREQKLEPERESGSKPANSTPTTTDQKVGEGSGAQPFRPLQYGELGWEKSADRPPKKLPIRFKDAVGRKYIFPWEKAKTWAGMRRLVRSCFDHVDAIAPVVTAGRYDLIATSIPSATSPDVGSEIGESPNGDALPQAPPPSTPAHQDTGIIILPDLWEDLIEPGMSISMHIWPMNLPPQPQQLPSTGPLLHPPGVQTVPIFHGRGQGMARGAGRGIIVPPFRPAGWQVIEVPKPKGKTRKRQDGL
ncbi:hypothetical protein F5B19DRAFT_451484 [Rostrohypoxylon terebratum]|nr:hypothetical protein F5B19DRAFT_451484 [Rostrohypoxylon terebratum]